MIPPFPPAPPPPPRELKNDNSLKTNKEQKQEIKLNTGFNKERKQDTKPEIELNKDVKPNIEFKQDVKEPDTNKTTYEEEKVALILGITSIFTVWWIFK